MSGKNINFGDKKKSKKANFTKIKKYFEQMILMLVKYKFLKKNDTAKRMHVNTLLDIMITTLLDHYV